MAPQTRTRLSDVIEHVDYRGLQRHATRMDAEASARARLAAPASTAALLRMLDSAADARRDGGPCGTLKVDEGAR